MRGMQAMPIVLGISTERWWGVFEACRGGVFEVCRGAVVHSWATRHSNRGLLNTLVHCWRPLPPY